MIDYILELAADLDHAIQNEPANAAFVLARPLADELERFDAGDFIPEVRADLVRIRTDVRRMCTNILTMHYEEIWAEDYPRLQQLVKGYVGKRGQGAVLPQRPLASSAKANPGQKDIFVSYAHEDEDVVRALVRFLQATGYTTWFDKDDLLGGQEWETVIPKAIAASQLVMLVFSSHSVKKRGFVQKELRLAVDEASKIPPSQVYIMPIRLDLCEWPDAVSRYHVIDLFSGKDFPKLLESVKHALNKAYEVAEADVAHDLGAKLNLIQDAARSTLTGPLSKMGTSHHSSRSLSVAAQELLTEITNDARSDAKGLMIAMATPSIGFYVPYLWDHYKHSRPQVPPGDMTQIQTTIQELVSRGLLAEYHRDGDSVWYVLAH